MNTSSDDQQPH